jgi:hypothetical protein
LLSLGDLSELNSVPTQSFPIVSRPSWLSMRLRLMGDLSVPDDVEVFWSLMACTKSRAVEEKSWYQ